MKEGWTYKSLGSVSDIKAGFTPSPDELSSNGCIPYFKVGDMNTLGNEVYLHETESYLTDSFSRKFPKGAIVFPKNGAAIGTNKKRILAQDSVVDLNTAVLIPHNTFLPKFVYYWIQHIDFREITRRGAIPTLDIHELKFTKIPNITLEEQERIVAELDLLTGIIDKQKAQLKELDTLAQSIFYDMFGDPVENEKGWEKKQLGLVCVSKKQIQRAKKRFNNSDTIQYIDISSIDNINNVITSTTSYVFGDAPSRAQQVVEIGDILISLVRPNLNNVAMVSEIDYNLVASSGFCVLRASREIVKEFLFFSVKMNCFTDYLMQRVSGANYPAVREDDIMGYSIITPPSSLQESFAQSIRNIEKQKQSITRSTADTQKLFDYTMDKYFG